MKRFTIDLRLVILIAVAALALPAIRSAAAEEGGCPMKVAACPMAGGGCGMDGEKVAAGVTDEVGKPGKAATVKAEDYPLTTCPVAGGKLGVMGDPVKYDYKGREVRFCCKGCIAKFEKEPAKYLKVMDATIVAKEKASYPLTTCVVAGGKLGTMGSPIEYVAQNNHLVRFCCKGCIAKFEKDPKPYLKKIEDARKAAAKK